MSENTNEQSAETNVIKRSSTKEDEAPKRAARTKPVEPVNDAPEPLAPEDAARLSSTQPLSDEELAAVQKIESTAVKARSEEPSVVLFVDHPVHWPGVGSLNNGYNLVEPSVAELWLDRGWARKASAREVAKHYGVK